MINLATWTPSSLDRRTALMSGAGLVVLTLLITPFANLPLQPSNAFMPAVFAAAILAQAMTAFLLYGQFRITRALPLGLLSCAYLYAALAMVPYVLTYPGVFTADGWPGVARQASSWIWAAWHWGFLAGLLGYAASSEYFRRRPPPPDAVQLANPGLLLASLIAWAATVAVCIGWSHELPRVLGAQGWTPIFTRVIAPGGIALGAAALLALVRFTGLRTLVDLWLSVAVLATTFDIILTLAGGRPFTLGWYAARLELFCAAIAVLAVFLYQINRLYVAVHESNRVLVAQALLDGLTDLSNRRSFDQHIATAIALCARNRQPLTVLMIDIDHFKKYNDAYGHQAGDDCLRDVAHAIRTQVGRPLDVVARYGGEEFALVLADTHPRGALVVGERIRAAVEALHLQHAPSAHFPWVTVSVGACSIVPAGETSPAELLHYADDALYTAKRDGRNRVSLSSASEAAQAR